MSKIFSIKNQTHLKEILESLNLNELEYVIIGSSFASLAVAKYLKKKYVIFEQGNKFKINKDSKFNISSLGKIELKNNNHSISLGGTSNLWTGILGEMTKEELCNDNGNNIWPLENEELKNYYLKSWKFFGYSKLKFKNIFNDYFEIRKFFVQKRPLRTTKEFLKLNCNIILNIKLQFVDQINNKVFLYLKTPDKKITKVIVNNVILCNGTFGIINLIFNSIKHNFLEKIKYNKYIGSNYMNHPKIKLPVKIRAENIHKNLKFTKFLKNNDKYYYGFSLKNKFDKKNKLNNSYFRFIPKYKCESDNNFYIANFIFTNKKFFIRNFIKLLFKKKEFIKNISRTQNYNIDKLALILNNPFNFLLNYRNLKYYLHFFNLKRLKTDYYELEFYFENTQKNNYILIKNEELKIKLDLCEADKNTFRTLITKINKVFDLNLIFDDKYLNNAYLNDASHHLGGFSYLKNNSSTLVNKNLQINNYDKIYVCSSSIFPTAGSVNPTLTIVALGIRLSDFLNNK